MKTLGVYLGILVTVVVFLFVLGWCAEFVYLNFGDSGVIVFISGILVLLYWYGSKQTPNKDE